jgi:hypothetical protein
MELCRTGDRPPPRSVSQPHRAMPSTLGGALPARGCGAPHRLDPAAKRPASGHDRVFAPHRPRNPRIRERWHDLGTRALRSVIRNLMSDCFGATRREGHCFFLRELNDGPAIAHFARRGSRCSSFASVRGTLGEDARYPRRERSYAVDGVKLDVRLFRPSPQYLAQT